MLEPPRPPIYPVWTRPRRCSRARPAGHAHHLSSQAYQCPATPNNLSGHAHPPVLTRPPRSGPAHPSRPVTPICLVTPTRPVEPRPPVLSGLTHPPMLPLLPRSGHAHPIWPDPPIWPATPTLLGHARPPCLVTCSRPVQPRLPICEATPTSSGHAHPPCPSARRASHTRS